MEQKTLVLIGIRGENGTRRIELDVSEILAANSEAAIALYVQRDGDEYPYIATGTTVTGHVMTWIPSGTDTSIAGPVKLQLIGTVDEAVVKTIILSGVVLNSLGASTEPPEALQPWVDAMTEALETVAELPSTEEDLEYILG